MRGGVELLLEEMEASPEVDGGPADADVEEEEAADISAVIEASALTDGLTC